MEDNQPPPATADDNPPPEPSGSKASTKAKGKRRAATHLDFDKVSWEHADRMKWFDMNWAITENPAKDECVLVYDREDLLKKWRENGASIVNGAKVLFTFTAADNVHAWVASYLKFKSRKAFMTWVVTEGKCSF